MPGNDLFHQICDERLQNALEKRLQTDQVYQACAASALDAHKALKGLGLSRRQALVVDRVLSASNAVGAQYGRAAYEQGFQDALELHPPFLSPDPR